MSLIVHQLVSGLFFAVVLLPVIALIKSRRKSLLTAIPFWRKLIMLANISLLISVLTGIILFPKFTSFRVWLAIILVIILGALLGILAKQLKLYDNENDNTFKESYLRKIVKIGFFYIIILIATILFMSNWYSF